MENNELIEIQGKEGLYMLNKPKIYKEIQILEKGYLIKGDKEIDVIGGKNNGICMQRNNTL